jgi:hypothetical protein
MTSSLCLSGNLRKLKHHLDADNKVNYFLRLEKKDSGEKIEEDLNQYLGKKINLSFNNSIRCVACDRSIKKTFNNGYCFPCLQTLAECDTCIIKPELCHFDKGTCRDNEFAVSECNIPHSIYLSLTSDLKIGITRQKQELSRWVDQGAVKALRIVTVSRRYHAGLIENFLAAEMKDKTNWRKMLKSEYQDYDLKFEQEKLFDKINNNFKEIDFVWEQDQVVQDIKYPMIAGLDKITSLDFEKSPNIEGTLIGIKAQYLIFDIGVINIRKFSGYEIEMRQV